MREPKFRAFSDKLLLSANSEERKPEFLYSLKPDLWRKRKIFIAENFNLSVDTWIDYFAEVKHLTACFPIQVSKIPLGYNPEESDDENNMLRAKQSRDAI